MSLSPIFYHYFRTPIPYLQTLALQEKIHSLQLSQRLKTPSSPAKDILLLLQHRPVYTAGRRQTDESTRAERERLTGIGADFVTATRGGQLTYHGPGQLVGYPLLDLSRYTPTMGARDYVCKMQKFLERYLHDAHGIRAVASEHTGVFLDERTKIASIGVQIRHRLTSHGFAVNITREPLGWFGEIVACGLDDVKAGSVESATGKAVEVGGEIGGVVAAFGKTYGREMVELDVDQAGEVGDAINKLVM